MTSQGAQGRVRSLGSGVRKGDTGGEESCLVPYYCFVLNMSMSYQQAKYLFDATTRDGEAIVIDFMKIESFKDIHDENNQPVTPPVVEIKMSAGEVLFVQATL